MGPLSNRILVKVYHKSIRSTPRGVGGEGTSPRPPYYAQTGGPCEQVFSFVHYKYIITRYIDLLDSFWGFPMPLSLDIVSYKNNACKQDRLGNSMLHPYIAGIDI